MTVYVDDIVFSSSKLIDQKFINSLFGIVKKNKLNIKKSKVKLYGLNHMKKITGLCITTGGVIRVPNSKHFETKIQYDYLTSIILKLNNMNDYFAFYNLFLKFKGNVQFIELVEEKVSKKYIDFINEYSIYFEYGIKKNKKSNCYSKENISLEDYNKKLAKYELLRKKIDSTKSKCN